MTDVKNNISSQNSLLYDLSNNEIDQIISDYKCFKEISFTFFIDANDILSHIDPYNLIYPDDDRLFKTNLADSFYAIKSLLKFKAGKIYLLKEYAEEFSLHKKKFNEISSISKDFKDKLREFADKKNDFWAVENDEKIRQLVSEHFSELYFIVWRRDKPFYDLYQETFNNNKIKQDHELEQSYFSDESIFGEEEHSEKIKMIYDLFPTPGYSSLIDSIAIYKIFLMNRISRHDVRYIYFSSASKSKVVMNKLQTLIDNREWQWLKYIMLNNPGEELFFFRNRNYSFGYIIYKTLNKKTGDSEKIFKEYCTLKGDNKIISGLLKKARESIENLSIFADCKLDDEELKYSYKSNKNIEYLFQKIISLKQGISNTKKIDIVDEEIFATDLIKRLHKFSQEHELIINRGKDNIISLPNTIPPLFIFQKDSSKKTAGFYPQKTTIEELALHACAGTSEAHRISREAALALFEKKESNNNEINNLLIIFLLIIIKYKTDSKKDSDIIAYESCEKFEKYISKKIHVYNLASEDNKRQIEKLEALQRELQVLKAWALRRTGEPFNKLNLVKSKFQHKVFADKYPNDYRFYLSHFLTRVNWLYPFKDLYHNNINEINQYVEETIRIGVQAMERINAINDSEGGVYLYQIQKTMINSLCFVYCVRLDLLLLQNKGLKVKSKKSIKLLEEIVYYKKLRKEENLQFEDNYESRTVTQPVFSYVESYVEYLEASMQRTKVLQKLKYAEQSISDAISLVKKDEKHRAFFLDCCEKLAEVISRKINKLDSEYESFIMKVKTG